MPGRIRQDRELALAPVLYLNANPTQRKLFSLSSIILGELMLYKLARLFSFVLNPLLYFLPSFLINIGNTLFNLLPTPVAKFFSFLNNALPLKLKTIFDLERFRAAIFGRIIPAGFILETSIIASAVYNLPTIAMSDWRFAILNLVAISVAEVFFPRLDDVWNQAERVLYEIVDARYPDANNESNTRRANPVVRQAAPVVAVAPVGLTTETTTTVFSAAARAANTGAAATRIVDGVHGDEQLPVVASDRFNASPAISSIA